MRMERGKIRLTPEQVEWMTTHKVAIQADENDPTKQENDPPEMDDGPEVCEARFMDLFERSDDEIRRLPARNVLVVSENLSPLVVLSYAFFDIPHLKQRAGLPYGLPFRMPPTSPPGVIYLPAAQTPIPLGPQQTNPQDFTLL